MTSCVRLRSTARRGISEISRCICFRSAASRDGEVGERGAEGRIALGDDGFQVQASGGG